jgi:hypothetical protein
MQSRKLGAVLSLAALAAAVALFVVLRDDDGSEPETAAPTTTTAPATEEPESQQGDRGAEEEEGSEPREPQVERIVVRGGEPVGGVAELSFEKGETIRFVVVSDVADHVHLHGYDVFQDLPAGGRAVFAVRADIEGRFEVELEDRAVPLAEITVNP